MKKWFLTFLALVFLGTACILFTSYDKWACEWIFFGWMHISPIWTGAVIAALVVFGLHRIKWFTKKLEESPKTIVWTLVIGFVLSMFLGIYFTEPISDGKTAHQLAQEQSAKTEYVYTNTRAGYWYSSTFIHTGGSSSGSGFSFPSSTSSSKDSGKAIAILFLVVVVILLVAGSAFLPHFWVAALIVLVFLMIDIAAREWDVERQAEHRRRVMRRRQAMRHVRRA